MKRLTHMELAALQGSAREHVLWEHAIPLVKLTVGRMARGGSIRREDVDDDLLQEGMLIAGKAIKTWRPIECAFSTHIVNRVRGDLLNYATERGAGGIGSYKQEPVVLSISGTREDARPASDDDEGGDDRGDDGTFEAVLTYGGVVKPGGQMDGRRTAPTGYANPLEEADQGRCETAVRAAVAGLPHMQRDLVEALMGFNGSPETLREYAVRNETSYGTIHRRYAAALKVLDQSIANFRH